MAEPIIRRTYRLLRWAGWDHQLHSFVEEFSARYAVAPNVLLANETTFARIDMAAQREHLVNDEGRQPDPGETATLTGFTGPDYHLMFALDEALTDLAISLIYDSDPDGGGESIPELDTDQGTAEADRAVA